MLIIKKKKQISVEDLESTYAREKDKSPNIRRKNHGPSF